ncbi:MAG: hypothetical protein AYP45_05230 [Candidatus Brocadia carolinensis]|uniref:Uncharacterized protein n=1 Tax=Candidatus Brocadia carolinensis TaxID=1004156 RepID=A0A1V4AVF6_9BACT|nr:MAG: hypothetical protein AYP45_05230 [Candidatus Brocadia caroliniensis]
MSLSLYAVYKEMKIRLLIEAPLFLCVLLVISGFSYAQGEQGENNVNNIQEKLTIENHNLEKLRTQLQILETSNKKERLGQGKDGQPRERKRGKQDNKTLVVINPNENITITKEIDEYDIPVCSIDAVQVKITDVLQALSASFGKSILVDDELDPTSLASYVNISIKKKFFARYIRSGVGYARFRIYPR